MLVFLDTGVRVGELVALQIKDYESKRGQLTIRHGKGDKKRVVYLGETAKRALWRYLNTRRGAKQRNPLFTTRTGRPMDRAGVRMMIVRAGERAGVPHAGPHRFRHTFAINFLRNGGNMLALQQILGHEQMDTVRIYAQQAAVDLQRAQRSASPADNWRL